MASSSSPSPTDALHFDKEDSVTLIVGSEKRELLVHANYIARTSAFFESALKKEWREGQIRTISMPEHDYESMKSYLRFLYGGGLPSQSELQKLGTGGDPSEAQLAELQAAYESLAKIYVLGCGFMDETVKNTAVTKIFDLFQNFRSRCAAGDVCNPGPVTVNTIYNGTMERDPARRIMVDMHIMRPLDLSS